MDKETIYGKKEKSNWMKSITRTIKSIYELMLRFVSIMGSLLCIVLGLSGVSRTPLTIQVGLGDPTRLLYSFWMGWILLVFGLIGLISLFIDQYRGLRDMIKKAKKKSESLE